MSKQASRKHNPEGHPAGPDSQPAADPQAGGALESDLDKLSLTQALADFEIANARVVDLTRRLVEASAALREATDELETLKIAHRALRAEHQQVTGSKAFRIVQVIWAVRRSLRT